VAPLLGAPEARGPGSLNRLNPQFLRHCKGLIGRKGMRSTRLSLVYILHNLSTTSESCITVPVSTKQQLEF